MEAIQARRQILQDEHDSVLQQARTILARFSDKDALQRIEQRVRRAMGRAGLEFESKWRQVYGYDKQGSRVPSRAGHDQQRRRKRVRVMENPQVRLLPSGGYGILVEQGNALSTGTESALSLPSRETEEVVTETSSRPKRRRTTKQAPLGGKFNDSDAIIELGSGLAGAAASIGLDNSGLSASEPRQPPATGLSDSGGGSSTPFAGLLAPGATGEAIADGTSADCSSGSRRPDRHPTALAAGAQQSHGLGPQPQQHSQAAGAGTEGSQKASMTRIGMVASLIWSQVPKGERKIRLQEAAEHLLESGVEVDTHPPHRRVAVFDPIRNVVIKGEGAPKVRAAVRWFARHPYFYVHLPTMRSMFGTGPQAGAIAGGGAAAGGGGRSAGAADGEQQAEVRFLPRGDSIQRLGVAGKLGVVKNHREAPSLEREREITELAASAMGAAGAHRGDSSSSSSSSSSHVGYGQGGGGLAGRAGEGEPPGADGASRKGRRRRRSSKGGK